MWVAVLLVLLFCLTGPRKAHGKSEEEAPETTQADPVWNELSDLRDMLVQQKVDLRTMEFRQKEGNDVIADMDIDLEITIRTVENLEKVRTAQGVELNTIRTRLNSSETNMDELNRENHAIMSRLTESERELDELKEENTDLY
ncbi:hypothetical protein DPEC_G00030330 [Dallia pectoralis]|uniref:Uncharacterized protein n=1 Tax=Dallia pectoralis TaxID=75939 RepID=A0ACC2HCQ0_DALPE|nr:hypothetical protein DPEC_G00030330 [Dallia pectoralis]